MIIRVSPQRLLKVILGTISTEGRLTAVKQPSADNQGPLEIEYD